MFRVSAPLRFIDPQLASPVEQPPEGKHWIHEIKNDGYRSQLVIEEGKARVFTRNGYDWSDRYPAIVRAASNLRCKSAIIDGRPSFKTAMVHQTSMHCPLPFNRVRIALFFAPSIFCTSMAWIFASKS